MDKEKIILRLNVIKASLELSNICYIKKDITEIKEINDELINLIEKTIEEMNDNKEILYDEILKNIDKLGK